MTQVAHTHSVDDRELKMQAAEVELKRREDMIEQREELTEQRQEIFDRYTADGPRTTFLGFAAADGANDLVVELLKGYDKDGRDKFGQTPLMPKTVTCLS